MRKLKSSSALGSTMALQMASLAAALALPLAAPGQAHAQTTPEASPSATEIDEVIVTARRRDERLQDVPQAVTAFEGETLADKGVTDVRALAGIIPNVTIEFATTSSSSTQIFMRGVGIDSTGFNVDPSVGVYVDDIFMGRLVGSNVNPMDIERIEVLRGPQGTLYGRSSTAGALKYVTVKPDVDNFLTRLMATVGTDEQRDYGAIVNIPLIEGQLGLRLSAQQLTREGYITLRDAAGVATGDMANGVDRLNLRGALRYQPTDDLTIDLTASYTDDQSGLQASTPINCAALPLVPGILGSGAPGLINAGQFRNCPRTYAGSPYQSFQGPFPFDDPEFQQTMLTGTVAWNVGGGTFRSITGYRDFSDIFSSHITGAPPPNLQINLRQVSDQSQFQQEFQYSAEIGDNFDYVVGLFYYTEDIQASYSTQVGTLATVPYRNEDQQTSTSTAVYGEAYFRPMDRVEITVGGRYSQDSRSVDRAILLSPYIVPLGTFSGSIDSEDFSPRIGVNYDTGPVMLYATYSEGYRPPGFVNTSPSAVSALGQQFEQETETMWEVGFKSSWFDNHFTWNLSAFDGHYDNFEATLLVAGVTVAVVSDADISGVESEMVWRPIRGLSMFANGSTFDSTYTTPPPGQPYAVELKHAPPWTASFGGSYDFSLGQIPGEFFIGADSTTTPATYRNVANTQSNRSEQYTLVTARLGYRSGDGRWTATVGGANLLNEEYWNLGTANRSQSFQPPRRVYVSVTAAF